MYLANEPALPGLTNAVVMLVGGDLPVPTTNTYALSVDDDIIDHAPDVDSNQLTLVTSKPSGTISGAFADPAHPGRKISIHGVVLQNQTNAAGYFLGTNSSGLFYDANDRAAIGGILGGAELARQLRSNFGSASRRAVSGFAGNGHGTVSAIFCVPEHVISLTSYRDDRVSG